MRIAILGANGFVGARAVEYLTLAEKADVRCVVRRYAGLARFSRFATVDWCLADATNEGQLAVAFKGCDFVLHSIMGDNDDIARCAGPAYRAAERTGIKRIIFISSAAVHSDTSLAVIDEGTAISMRRLNGYAVAKFRAEKKFLALSKSGAVGVVVLRPSIIIGPRSYWVSEPARQLLSGEACLVDGGPGLCNTIYVDDLINAALLACKAEAAQGNVFLLANGDSVTWGEYYRKLADLLKVPSSSIRNLPAARAQSLEGKLSRLRSRNAFQAASLLTPKPVKDVIRRMLNLETDPLRNLREEPSVRIAPEMVALHLARARFSSEKAQRLLGYHPELSLDEALRRSVAWLQFAGWIR